MKIFGIGLSKTGTSSLAQALTLLGYKTRDYPGLSHYSTGDLSSIDPALLEEFDALTDTPIPSFFRELDARFPDAKFILTLRDREGWLNSCKKQFTQKLADKQNEAHNRLFMDLYDSTVFDEEKFSSGYDRFVQSVHDHFKDRPGKLLTMNVVAGDGWEKLCPFLGKPLPDLPFPKANVTRIRWMKMEDLASAAKDAGDILLKTHELMLYGGHPAKKGSRPRRLGDRLARIYFGLRGGRSHALLRASQAAHDILVHRLTMLNRDIPIVSRLGDTLPFMERGRWNHFWLIDPLDGPDGFAALNGEFSVNIALIEDQKPIYGVVHAPISGTTYHAVAGKGAFKSMQGGATMNLGNMPPAYSNERGVIPASKALRLCLLAEDTNIPHENITDTQEWHSAAAQLVVHACGRQILDCTSHEELRYNKTSLENPCITVRR